MPRPRKPDSPFRYFNSSPEIIRLVVMIYVRFPLSLRNVEDLLLERGIAKDFERTIESATAWLYLASIQFIARRIASL